MSQSNSDLESSSQAFFEISNSQTSDSEIPSTPVQPKQYSPEISRDDRIRIQLLYSLGWKYHQISEHLSVTTDQIKYSLNRPLPDSLTPRRNRSGTQALLNTPLRRRLVNWLEASPSRLELCWKDIPFHLDLGIPFNERAVRTALQKEGFSRRVRRVRPVLSPANRQKRLQFAMDYEDWNAEQ